MATVLAPRWTPTPALIDDELEESPTPPNGISRDELWRELKLERQRHQKLRAAYRALMTGQTTMPGVTLEAVQFASLDLRRKTLRSALVQLMSACRTAVRPPAHVADKLRVAELALEWDNVRGGSDEA